MDSRPPIAKDMISVTATAEWARTTVKAPRRTRQPLVPLGSAEAPRREGSGRTSRSDRHGERRDLGGGEKRLAKARVVGVRPGQQSPNRRSEHKAQAKRRTNDTTEPARLIRRTGRRPQRSLTQPQKNEKKKATIEKVEKSRVTRAGEASKCSAQNGIKGMMIPNPTRIGTAPTRCSARP